MKTAIKTVLTGLTALLLVGSAIAADKRIVLRMDDDHLKGQNRVSIQREIRDQFPSLKLNRFTLDNIVVVAKSRLGKGRIKLEVDNTTSFSHQVGGYPSEFHDRDAYTFYRTKIINPAYSSRGRWNLLLSGNFKLRKIIVNLNRANSYDDFEPVPRIRFTKVGTLQFSKMYEETKRVRIAKDNVKVIKIKSLRNAVRLLDVEVVFRNGNTRFLSELEGVILNGRTKEITFRNVRDIQTLRITAVPRMTNYGERGTLQVSVGKLRR